MTQTEALGLHEVSKGTLIKYFWWWALIIKSNPTLWNLFQKLLNTSKVLKCFSFYHSIISRWVPAQVRKIQCLQFSNMNWAKKKKSVIKRFKEHNHMDSCHRIIRNTGQVKLYSRDFSLDVTCCIETCFVYFWQQKCVKILTYSWKNQTYYLTFLTYLTFLIHYLTFLISLTILTYLTILTHYLTFLTHYLTSHNSDSISHFWLIISFLLIIPYLTSHFDSLSHNSYLSHISHFSHFWLIISHLTYLIILTYLTFLTRHLTFLTYLIILTSHNSDSLSQHLEFSKFWKLCLI